MADTKDVIYIDVEEEITAIIDKVKQSPGKVVSLVLPKRSSVLQSIVNLKLLKRTGDNEKKNLVLVTAEAGLLPLAGAVGLHVASSLSAQPQIPSPPQVGGGESETLEEDMSLPLDDEDEAEKPDLTEYVSKASAVGALAEAAKPKAKPGAGALETLELDNEEPKKPALTPKPEPPGPKKKSKHLKVPNFNRFRTLLLLGALVLIGLIILIVLMFFVWPHATVDIKTDAANVNVSVPLDLDTQAQSVNLASGDIPAKSVSEQKTFTATVPTTGHENEGNTATGQVNMSVTDCNDTYGGEPSFTIPAGTTLSAAGLSYITQEDTQMQISSFNFKTDCADYNSTAATQISAQSPGSAYNTPSGTSSSFTVSGYSGVTATGSASGGTDNIVQVVAQADVNSAAAKINNKDSGVALGDLSNQLKGEGLYPIDATFTSSNPQISTSPNVGDQATSETVTDTITYTMFGAKQSDISAVVDANIRTQTSQNQNIVSNGVNQSAFKQNSSNGASDQVTLTTVAEVGPNLSAAQIKKDAAGKSPSDAIAAIRQNPDVTSVTIKLSPFWVGSVPSSISKITVSIAKPSLK